MTGGLVPNKIAKKNVRLTERDLYVVRWIAEQQAVRLDTIGLLLKLQNCGVDDRALRRLAQRWQALGLIQRARLIDAPSILWATPAGMRCAGLALHRGEKTTQPSFSTLHHTLAVARVRLEYNAPTTSWTCEWALRKQIGGAHLADGMANTAQGRVLIEVDRTQKESVRLAHIMASNVRMPGIDRVDYWTTPQLLAFITRQRDSLDTGIRDRVEVHLLPQEVQ